MASDLLTHPEIAVPPTPVDDDRDCIVCRCRPLVSYCGRGLLVGSVDDDPWSPDEVCRECFAIWATTGCPGCGCVRAACCRRCQPPWWIRMWR